MLIQMMDNQEIKLDGLTIIVGLNNSGKTTVINKILHTKIDDNYNALDYNYPIELGGYDVDTNLELEYYKNQVILLDGVDRKCDPKNIIKLAENICRNTAAGIKYVVTTFNPDFLKALNYYSKKYKIENVTNYYQTENIDDKIIISDKTKQLNKLYELLTSDISEIFFKSVQQDLQKMKDEEEHKE